MNTYELCCKLLDRFDDVDDGGEREEEVFGYTSDTRKTTISIRIRNSITSYEHIGLGMGQRTSRIHVMPLTPLIHMRQIELL